MDAQTMRFNLLEALARIAQQHATILTNELPGTDPCSRQSHLTQSAAQVTTAKMMCRAAGIEEDTVRAIVDACLPQKVSP